MLVLVLVLVLGLVLGLLLGLVLVLVLVLVLGLVLVLVLVLGLVLGLGLVKGLTQDMRPSSRGNVVIVTKFGVGIHGTWILGSIMGSETYGPPQQETGLFLGVRSLSLALVH